MRVNKNGLQNAIEFHQNLKKMGFSLKSSKFKNSIFPHLLG